MPENKFAGVMAAALLSVSAAAAEPATPTSGGAALKISDQAVGYNEALDVLVFEVTTEGRVGATTPEAAGQLDGAPVLGYVFPTTLV